MSKSYKNRWYVLDKSGAATLCVNREDAEKAAQDADWLFTTQKPHTVTRILPLDSVKHTPTGILYAFWCAYGEVGDDALPYSIDDIHTELIDRQRAGDEFLADKCLAI